MDVKKIAVFSKSELDTVIEMSCIAYSIDDLNLSEEMGIYDIKQFRSYLGMIETYMRDHLEDTVNYIKNTLGDECND